MLERKRDILLRELRNSIYESERARTELLEALAKAYQAIKEANMAKGSETIANVACGSRFEADFLMDFKSIMGVVVPAVEFQSAKKLNPTTDSPTRAPSWIKRLNNFMICSNLLLN